MYDSVCKEGIVPHPDFCPNAIGMPHVDDRPITMSGMSSYYLVLPYVCAYKCKINVYWFLCIKFGYKHFVLHIIGHNRSSTVF